MKAHLFRFAGEVHVVTSTRSKVKRNGKALTMCAKRVMPDAQRIAPHHEPGRTAPITCDNCSNSLTGLFEALETDFGFPPPTKHGRSANG